MAVTNVSAEEDTQVEETHGPEESPSAEVPPKAEINQAKGWRFWAMFISLCITSLLSALDATIVSTVLPTIVEALKSESLYAWALNSFFLSMTTVQPLYGQTANIFGRRWLVITAIVLFAIGSGICGGASNTAMFIAGRVIQGLGGGGINVMIDMVVCDLVPQRERGQYMGLVFAVYAIGTTLGPILGGIFAHGSTWRWAFYLNLPIVGVALPLIVIFLQVNYDRETHMLRKLARIDYTGNFLLTASVISVLLGIISADTVHPWSSWRTIVPIVIGGLGHIAFIAHQASPKLAPEPTVPLHLFSNRSGAAAFGLTFVAGILQYWVVYFIPLYFQSVKVYSPGYAGVAFLPSVLITIPFAIISGGFISVANRYRPPQLFGTSLLVIGLGILTLLDRDSTKGEWVGYQIVAAAGSGLLLTCTLPAIQAPLEEKYVATATGTWGFLRSYGSIWGVSIPSAVFNSKVNRMLHIIPDDNIREMLSHGAAYQHGTKVFIGAIKNTNVKSSVIEVFSSGLKLVWQVGIAFAGLGLIFALLVKEIPMLQQLETAEFGMADKKEEEAQKNDPEKAEPAVESSA